MKQPHIVLGGVYEIASYPEPVRVVAFDGHVVMYDVWWPHKAGWAMAKLLGSFTYCRMTRAVFEARSVFLREDPLTAQELSVHRPDLPFAFARRAKLSWYERWGEVEAAPVSFSTGVQPILDAPAIFLAPFGPRDSAKPPVLVHAANGHHFTEVEVLRLAKEVQEPFIGELRLTDGVGLYRSGIKKRLPSYYLWGARSRLDSPDQNAA